MSATDLSRPSPLRVWGFLCTALGALALGVGALLPWASVNIGGAGFSHSLGVDTKGTDLSEGKIALAAAIVVLVVVIAMRLVESTQARKALAVVTIVVTLIAGGFVISAMVSANSTIGGEVASETAQKIADVSGLPLSAIQKIAENVTNVELKAGIYVALAGAVIALVGGVLGLMWAGQTPAPVASSPTVPEASAPAGSAEPTTPPIDPQPPAAGSSGPGT